ncbi:MAG: hypothetical protein J7L38_04590 [Thermoproteales archaeon]|nr:hypothetical protein [Thermoproteales archaeon]RLE66959.1 MAG: hypothetical protein DRJ47_01295 [Thermoprotei archaeon]
MVELLPQDILGLLYTLIYLSLIGIALSLIYGISEWFSKDRVLKIFEGKFVFVYLGKEVYYGRMKIHPRSGGGFEVIFPPEGVENPVALLAFLMENYRETGDKKFLEKAEKVLEEFKKRKILPQDYSLKDVSLNPWQPPSLVSRKIYANEIGNLYGIMFFKYVLSEEEITERWKELHRVYSPSPIRRLKRKMYNSLSYVKDKIGATLSKTTGTVLAPLTPEVRKGIEEIQAKLVGSVGASYDSFLEDSIGRLVTVQVTDPSGGTRFYQGILREYSNNYILVYDVDYKLQMKMLFRGVKEVEGYPQSLFSLYGYKIKEKPHLKVSQLTLREGKAVLKLVNTSNEYLRLKNVIVDGNEVKIFKTLSPKAEIRLEAPASSNEPTIEVNYEICREADIIWPRSKVKVIGLGDYPPDILGEILKSLPFRRGH